MTKNIYVVFLGLVLFCSCQREGKEILHIAVAANMQFAMKDVSEAFTLKTGIKCELIIGSSGKLTAQIKEGAPYDIFISANMKYPQELFKNGNILEEPKVFVYGKLVLWSAIKNIKPSIKMLKNPSIKHIALANPKIAPYGAASVEVLENRKIYKDVEEKLVYGESILQTNQFIISESAQIGFTSKSVVLSGRMKNKGNWIDISDEDYSPIAQGVVVIKQNSSSNIKKKNVEKYYQFLWSKEVRGILQNYGYTTIKN
ncbi:molybdate ABC transporter substrate-binding protein [Aquimarina sp. AU474]|uniref:molybdate ABC transporter substrate-binding protein n=1 Tax=Aquimarina sp. AU474 TaxID=2108529 RepID=UPI000D68F139|nr:molybdate ABC transporter substrate-binding protein [Aquimarina sp. AU474]